MNRFFFHFSFKDELITDTGGRECHDLLAAHYHATMLVHKMVSLDDMDWRGWSIKVTAADGRSVLSVLFPQVSCFQSANSKIPRERHRPLEPKQAGMQERWRSDQNYPRAYRLSHSTEYMSLPSEKAAPLGATRGGDEPI